MTVPAISVVIPCYNAERWIAATIRSVLGQEWPELEVIVVDDGSSDHSIDVVTREFPQVTVVPQGNAGVAAARNRGIERASGEWIAFIDADDIWLRGKLYDQWRLLAADPEARMACSGWYVWDSTDPEPDRDLLDSLAARVDSNPRSTGPSGWIYPDLLLDCQVWTSTVLMRRDLFDEIGNFDINLRIGEDLDLWLRASRVTRILRVQRPLALYRMHPGSITRIAPKENYQAMVIARAVHKWGYRSPDGRCAAKADIDRAVALTWKDFASAQLAAGNVTHARLSAWRALKLDWCRVSVWKLLAKSIIGAIAKRRV